MDLVPWDTQDVGEEALDEAVAAHDRLGVPTTVGGEGQGLVLEPLHIAIALEAADHLVHGGGGELHGASYVRARDRQARLLEPEHDLEILLLGDRGVLVAHASS